MQGAARAVGALLTAMEALFTLSPEFFINPRCLLGVVPVEAATIVVRSGEAMIASKRKVPTAVLEADISEADEHLSVVEVGLSNEHDSSARVTEESEGPDVSSGR